MRQLHAVTTRTSCSDSIRAELSHGACNMAHFEISPLTADSHESEEEVIDYLSSQDVGRAGSETGTDCSELAVKQTSSSDAEAQPATCCWVISAVLREVVPSLIATLIMAVYSISFTAVICTHPAFREHQGVLVTLAMGSAAVACFLAVFIAVELTRELCVEHMAGSNSTTALYRDGSGLHDSGGFVEV